MLGGALTSWARMPVYAALFRANSAWDAWWLWDPAGWLGNCCGTAGLVGLPGTGRAAGRGLRYGMLGSRSASCYPTSIVAVGCAVGLHGWLRVIQPSGGPGETQNGVSGSPVAFHWKDRKMIAYVLMQLPEIDDFSFRVVYRGKNFNS